MSTSRHYRTLETYLSLSDYVGIHHTIEIANIVLEETAHWCSFLIPTDKLNLLHVKSMRNATALDFDILFRVLTKDKLGDIARRKEEIAQKEKEEIQAEEAIVRSLLMEQ
jgi:Ulp1 family protease